uniref:Uncharacterized protein n=1 Tax=Anguilla anguilla TaxID=7936 RepID=A0A0E9S2U5_ANGAN
MFIVFFNESVVVDQHPCHFCNDLLFKLS